jgi:hypothetical protein
MATFKLVDNISAASGSTYTSASTVLDMARDDYGTIVVTHGGSRLASGAAVSVYLQGSLDGGTVWFDLDVMKPSDTLYVNGNLGSWARVVPVVPLVRILITNTSGSALSSVTAWLID